MEAHGGKLEFDVVVLGQQSISKKALRSAHFKSDAVAARSHLVATEHALGHLFLSGRSIQSVGRRKV